MNRKLFFTTFLMLLCSLGFGQHWSMNSDVAYPGNMTVFAEIAINNENQTSTDIELAAFCKGVVRGTVKPKYNSNLNKYIAALEIAGDINGEVITFKIFDPAVGTNGKEFYSDYTIEFENDKTIGSIIAPQAINFYERHWICDSSYDNVMTVVCSIIIDGVEQNRTDLEMAAFCGYEVRGVAKPVYWTGPNIYLTSLVIGGSDGERIDFKVYDPIQGIEIPTEYYVTFVNDAMIGEDSPLSIEFITTPYVAQVGNKKYQSLEKALKALTEGSTLTILENITISEKWDNRYTGAKVSVPVTIDGKGKTIKFTGEINDGLNYTAAFRFEAAATIKNLKIDMSEAISSFPQRLSAVAAKLDITVDACTFIGNANYNNTKAIIFGEGASSALTDVKVNITNSHFIDWKYGVSDNQNAQDAKNVTIAKNVFQNASVNVSASEFVMFDENKLDNGNVTITSYTNNTALKVEAIKNTLDATKENSIKVDPTDNINAQEGFLLPVAKIGSKYYLALNDAIAAAKAGDVVTVFEGTYTMPSMKAGITIVGEGEVVFNGTLSGTLENLTMKNIHIKGSDAQRWAYAKGNLVFENVTFEATGVYALHFDGITEGTNLTYKDCTIIGWAALGGTPASCTFEGCTIKGNGSYGVIRTYFNTTIKDCTFDVANVNTTDVYQDGIHAVGETTTVTVTNCTNSRGEMIDLVNVSGYSVVDLDGIKIMNVAKIAETEKHYWTVTEAINAAQSGQTVELLARTIDEAIKPWAGDASHVSEKSITIVGAENFGTTLKGGLFLGYDDSGCREHTITIEGIAFEGKGILVAGQKNVVIEGNKFTNITDVVATSQSATENAISVIGKNVNATVTGNVIDGTNESGIHLRDVKDATVTGNTVANTKGNSITINPTSGSNGTIAVVDNTLEQWGLGGEGRAMRISGGATVYVNENVMSNANAPEEFVKITGAATIDASANYWNGVSPLTEGMFYTDLTSDPVGILKSYYTDAEKTNLVILSASVAKIGNKYYQTLQAAIDACVTGDNTIVLLATISEDVTIKQVEGINVTIDGDETNRFDYSGTFTIHGNARNDGAETLTFVNIDFTTNEADHYFIDSNSTASAERYAHNVTVENCNFTATGAGIYSAAAMRIRQGFNITINGGTFANLHSALQAYGNAGITVDGIELNGKNGISAGTSRKVIVKNSTIKATGYGVRADGDDDYDMKLNGNTIEANLPVVVRGATGAYNLTVEGGSYTASNEKGAVVTFTNGADGTFVHPTGNATAIIKDVNDVVVFGFVAKNNNKLYTLFKEALNEVANGQTIELLNAEGSENVDIEFTKNITFTVEGQAPNYALPVVTFQNAIVNIKDATIKTPELDARQNATINVINSTVYGVGSNDIIKSYYNGAINIDETSTVYTMQVTTMGYITVAGALNATWQTNVYGNGLITLNNGAQFKTAALQLTGQDYSGRDNTDENRVGKPAEIIVNNGANFTIGKVYASSGADYSYNSNKGINIGTVNGKSAVLTLNGGNVDIYMADGQNVNIGTDGIVNIGASTMKTICRTENGTVGLINNGVINFTSDNAILETATEGLTIGYNLNQDKKVVYKEGKYQVVDKIYVAQISEDKKFETLAEAAEAANGAEITIIRDFEEVYAVADNAVVNINFDGKTLTGSILAPNAKLTVANGTIINNDKGVSAIEINAGELTLNAVNISSERHAVRIDGVVTATIDGGTYKVLGSNKGTYHAANISGAANVKILNGTFVGPKGTSADSGSAVNVKAGATVTISGGEFSKGKNSTLASSGVLTLTGGTYDQDVQDYCAPSYICVKDNDLYKVIRGLIGSGTETDPYLIRNLTELKYFKESVNAGETTYNQEGVWVALDADIDMTSVANWAPIGSFDVSYDGNFNGQGHKIMNLKMSDDVAATGESYLGFFGVTANNVIKDFVIENVTIESEGQIVAAAIAYPYYTTVSDITVCGDIAIEGGNYTAGVLAYTRLCVNASNLTVSGNSGSYITGAQVVGGVISDIQMNHGLVANYSNFSASGLEITGTMNVGGISGIISGQTLNGATVKNVTLNCSDARVGVVSGSLGIVSTISNVVAESVTGATAVIGATYDNAKAIEARIGDTYYATLEAALLAEGNNVTLLVPYTVEADETVVLDLNGKTVSMEDASAATSAMIKNYGNLTISNGKLSFKATVPSANNAYASNTISNYGEITIESGIIENLSTGSACYALDNYAGSTATINGGKLTAEKTTVRVFNWTNGEANATTLNVNDGEIYSKDGYGINVNSGNAPYVALNIAGGTITTDDTDYNLAVYVVNNDSAENFTVNVTAGTFNGNFALNGVTSTTMATGNVSISGGTFDGVICYATPAYGFITGGAFVNDPSAFVAENYGAVYNGEYFIVKLISGTQTREFASAGWHWFSTYINLEGAEGLETLQDALVNEEGVCVGKQIKGQDGFTQYFSGYNAWSPGLPAITTSEMYMVNVTAPVTVELTGNFVDYENRYITLTPGWNWIGYPVRETVAIENALAKLNPKDGDIIKPKSGTGSQYYEAAGGWFPSFNLVPGHGYKYLSVNPTTTGFYYTTENNSRGLANDNVIADNRWNPAASEFAENMVVIAMLNINGEVAGENYEVAAFANGVCRGSARPIYNEKLDKHILFMTINGEEVEELTFKCYNINSDEVFELNDVITYSNDAVLGSLKDPYIFNCSTLGIGENSLNDINIYPNPTTRDRAINLQATCDNVEVFNALGVKVAEYQNVDSIDALETAGVYVIRVTINGEIKNCRLVVK